MRERAGCTGPPPHLLLQSQSCLEGRGRGFRLPCHPLEGTGAVGPGEVPHHPSVGVWAGR